MVFPFNTLSHMNNPADFLRFTSSSAGCRCVPEITTCLAGLACCLRPHSCCFFTIRSVQSRHLSASQPAHQAELAAVMDVMRQNRFPQHLPDRAWAKDKGDHAIQIFDLQLADSRDGFAMDPVEIRRERFNRPRTLDVRRLGLKV